MTTRGGGRYIPTHLRQKRSLTGEGAAGPAHKKVKKVHDASQEVSRVLPTQPLAVSSGSKGSNPSPVVQLPRAGATSRVKLATSPSVTEVIDLESPTEVAVSSVKTRRRDTAAEKLAEAEPKKTRQRSPQLEVRETPDLELRKLESEEAVAVVVPSTRHGAKAKQGSSPQLEVRVAAELEPKHPSDSEGARQVEIPVQSRPDGSGKKRKGGKATARVQKVKKPHQLDPEKQSALDHEPENQATVSPANSKRRKRDQLEPEEPDVRIRPPPASESPPAPKRRKSDEHKPEGAGQISSPPVIQEGEKEKDTGPDDHISPLPEPESPLTSKREQGDELKPEGEAGQTVSSPVIREGQKRKRKMEAVVHIRQRPESDSQHISKRRKSDEPDPEEAKYDFRPSPVVHGGEKRKGMEPDVRIRQQPESEAGRTSKRRKSDELDAEDEWNFHPLPVAQEGEKRKGMEPDVRIRHQRKSDSVPGGTKRRKLKDALTEEYDPNPKASMKDPSVREDDAKPNISMKDSSVQEVSVDAFERRATRSATRNTKTDVDTTSHKGKAKEKDSDEDLGREKWQEPLVYPKTGKKRAEVTVEDRDRLREDTFLNDNLIAFYLRFLEDHIRRTNEELAKRIYFCNSYLYEKLTTNVPRGETINYDAVEKWTRNINLFEYDYIIVPINEDQHWFLSIIYNLPTLGVSTPPVLTGDDSPNNKAIHEHPKDVLDIIKMAEAVEVAKDASVPSGSAKNDTQLEMDGLEWTNTGEVQHDASQRSLRSKSHNAPQDEHERGPPPPKKLRGSAYILTFDSLGISRSKSNNILRRYLMAEAEKKLGVEVFRSRILGRTIQNIPLQANYSDCGLYLLAYMEKFMQDPTGFVEKLMMRRLKKDDWPELESSGLRSRFRSFLDDLYDEQNTHNRPPQHPLMVDTTPLSFLLPPGEAKGLHVASDVEMKSQSDRNDRHDAMSLDSSEKGTRSDAMSIDKASRSDAMSIDRRTRSDAMSIDRRTRSDAMSIDKASRSDAMSLVSSERGSRMDEGPDEVKMITTLDGRRIPQRSPSIADIT